MALTELIEEMKQQILKERETGSGEEAEDHGRKTEDSG